MWKKSCGSRQEDNIIKDIETFKETLEVFKKRSTCCRLQVAALLVKEGRVISTGYNGVPSGHIHCDAIHAFILAQDGWNVEDQHFKYMHHEWSRKNEKHAELNAIGIAAKNGISTKDCDLYSTLHPCLQCSMLIETAGIKRVFFIDYYDRDTEANEFLTNCGIEVTQI